MSSRRSTPSLSSAEKVVQSYPWEAYEQRFRQYERDFESKPSSEAPALVAGFTTAIQDAHHEYELFLAEYQSWRSRRTTRGLDNDLKVLFDGLRAFRAVGLKATDYLRDNFEFNDLPAFPVPPPPRPARRPEGWSS